MAAEISAIESDIDALSGASDTTGERLFRPYAGGGVLGTHVFSPAAVDYLQQHRYTCVLWNVLPHDWDDPTGWVDTGFEQTAGTDWSVVVLHDIDTGAMRRLPEFLDGLDAQGAEFVTEFPGSCVPIKQGRPQWSMAHLTSSPDHRRRS
ncbi:hypothetical protein [Saccharomonospora sp. CUA-673]|uniref:hypothetical protein n=1 Tax=Saccharomonospora sp. CUA-673 TaxID=1904969 RepID=UPI0009F9C13F|nr:hypothetical protein [Saccharomonospora sp. CUA-673]